MPRTSPLPWLASSLAALALACSSPQRAEPAPTPPVTAPAADAAAAADASAAPAATASWDALSRDDLCRVVTEGAHARIREAQPDFELARLDAYLADPASAPEIAGRTADQLYDLAIVALVKGRAADAERTVRLIRARARNRNLAFMGTTMLAEVARRGAGDDEAAQGRAIDAVFGELPRPRFGSATVVFQLFQTQEQLTARVRQIHGTLVSQDTARAALWFGEVMPEVVRARARFLAAIERVRTAQNATPEPASYAFGTVNLAGARDARPVVVGVWDLGTNPALFQRQMYVNRREQPNGRDDDGDQLADDISGVVADGDAPNTALLYDPGADTIRQYAPFLRGVMDLRAGMASTPAAQRVLELQRGVTDEAGLDALDRNLDAIGEWSHGTHVAGIMLSGNPHARLAVFRSAWAGESRPYHHRGPTDAELDAERANMEAVARFINANQVRVVNASLGFSVEYLEAELRHERDRYHSDDEVRARARAVQARRKDNWRRVFELCPQTLFVVAAGNSNQDVMEYDEIPASIGAPNLLVVGAVDRWGGWATFTNSNPERVRVFDHGVEVDSLIPSGERVPLSGTSMASPGVACLAGKLFSLDAALTPERAIAVIAETGDPIAAPFNGRIANETRAVAAVRAARRPSAPGARPPLPTAPNAPAAAR
ncbi:MAG: S8 family serine peptidase [Polyangiales bacterium]